MLPHHLAEYGSAPMEAAAWRKRLRRIPSGIGHRLLALADGIYPSTSRSDSKNQALAAWREAGGDTTLRLEYDLQPNAKVLDVGGFEGRWASDIFSMYGCTIHVFEPVPQFAERLERRFRNNSRIVVHPVGLGASDEAVLIDVDADSSSVFGTTGHEVQVRMVEAGSFLPAQGIGRIDLMKINIEGGEYDLLEHLCDQGLNTVIGDIQVQFHDFVPDAVVRRRHLQDRLAQTHHLTYEYPFVWENWRLTEG